MSFICKYIRIQYDIHIYIYVCVCVYPWLFMNGILANRSITIRKIFQTKKIEGYSSKEIGIKMDARSSIHINSGNYKSFFKMFETTQI